MGMSGSRDLEQELWRVYDSVASVDDVLAKANVQLKALELTVKIRSAGDKAKPHGDPAKDTALQNARRAVNRQE
jgi:hypothetical protein